MDELTTKVYLNPATGERHYEERPRCKCEHPMTSSLTVKKVDVFQCDRCNRLLILNFQKEQMAWFIPEDDLVQTLIGINDEGKDK